MEISFRSERTREKPVSRPPQAAPAAGNLQFFSLLQQKLDEQQSLEDQLLAIDEQANRLVSMRTMEELIRYRQRVRAFLQTVVSSGLAVETVHGSERRRLRQYSLVKRVDELLLKLADEVFNRELPRLAILARLDEIRGLLVNLST